MSLLNENFDGDYAAEILPEGEHLVRITTAEIQGEDSDYPRINVCLSPIDSPDAQPVYHALFLPTGGEDDRARREQIQRFLIAFGLPLKKVDTDQWIGAEAFALVKHKASDEYGVQARVKKFVAKKK